VDVHARDSFAVKHVGVLSVIFKREFEIESELAKFAHSALLELPRFLA
jgi:hypothetical protein